MVSMLRAATVLGAIALATGCSSISNHRGYLMEQVLIASVQPGLDNRESVRGTLGTPTLTSQFGDPIWYYVSSTTEQAPFTTPDITRHSVLAVHFDEAGNVASTELGGIERIARIDPESDKTPVPGRDTSLLEDLFGNIGTVGAPGMGSGAGGP